MDACFRTTDNRGFQVLLNGYTVSVQFGPSNYCANRKFGGPYASVYPNQESPDAEIAIWAGEDGPLLPINGHDTVQGCATPVQVGKIFGFLANGTDLTDEKVVAFVRDLIDTNKD